MLEAVRGYHEYQRWEPYCPMDDDPGDYSEE